MRRCTTRAGEAGEIVVYGTVLPWNGDVGPDAAHPATGWEEFRRVVPAQGREWSALRDRYPSATLIVAGDLNQDMGGKHYYGTKAGRALLADQLSNADLRCLTSTDRFEVGVLEHPPIDHVCGGPGQGSSFTSSAHGWNNVVDGIKLSDHGGTIVTFCFNAGARRVSLI